MCRVERWSTRTLRNKIDHLLFERTAVSKKPDALIAADIAALRDEDRMMPDIVFLDPYLLDFLGLTDAFLETAVEQAILREVESFILELGGDFAENALAIRLAYLNRLDEAVERRVIEFGDEPEGIGALQDSSANLVGYLFRHEEKLVHVGIQHLGELADRVFAGEGGKIHSVVLNLRQVREIDPDRGGDRPLAQALRFSEFPNLLAEGQGHPASPCLAFTAAIRFIAVVRQHLIQLNGEMTFGKDESNSSARCILERLAFG
jgi:hypothetical protein